MKCDPRGKEQNFGEFEPLESKDEYAAYFNQLCIAFRKLMEVFNRNMTHARHPSHEVVTVASFLDKMLYTIRALRFKYTYNPNVGMKVDLSDSGFPSFIDIQNLTTDLQNREDYLANSSPVPTLKQKLLDYMFDRCEMSDFQEGYNDFLWRITERVYFEMLDYTKLMLTFTPGLLEMNRENDACRNYTFSWACYDFSTNRPYIHIMVFDQDIVSEPLENRAENFRQFLQVMKNEGSRAPNINVIALAIDRALEDIHPKELKRICIGPLCTLHYSKDPKEFYGLLEENAETENDFVLFYDDEIIVSAEQRISKSSIFSSSKVREFFSVPEADIRCYSRGASQVHQYILLPHYVLQHMDKDRFREYRNHEAIPYDLEEGPYECTGVSEN